MTRNDFIGPTDLQACGMEPNEIPSSVSLKQNRQEASNCRRSLCAAIGGATRDRTPKSYVWPCNTIVLLVTQQLVTQQLLQLVCLRHVAVRGHEEDRHQGGQNPYYLDSLRRCPRCCCRSAVFPSGNLTSEVSKGAIWGCCICRFPIYFPQLHCDVIVEKLSMKF